MNYAQRLAVATAMVIGSTISAAPANALDLAQKAYVDSFLDRSQARCGYFMLNPQNRERAYQFFEDGMKAVVTDGREGAYAPMNSPPQNFEAELCGIVLHQLGKFSAIDIKVEEAQDRLYKAEDRLYKAEDRLDKAQTRLEELLGNLGAKLEGAQYRLNEILGAMQKK